MEHFACAEVEVALTGDRTDRAAGKRGARDGSEGLEAGAVAEDSAAREEGYRTVEAGNGREALAALAVEWPSLILLDLEMPVMSGWAFMRELRARAVHIPVIIMSGRTDQASELAEMGAKSFVGKPIDLPALLDKIARHQRQTTPPIDYGLA